MGGIKHMGNLFKPTTWVIIFLIGIVASVQYFFKNKNIFRRIGIIHIIFIMYLAMDYMAIHLFTEYYFVNKFVLPILVIGFMTTMYLEDYYDYKKNKAISKREMIKNTLKYFYVVIFIIFAFWIYS